MWLLETAWCNNLLKKEPRIRIIEQAVEQHLLFFCSVVFISFFNDFQWLFDLLSYTNSSDLSVSSSSSRDYTVFNSSHWGVLDSSLIYSLESFYVTSVQFVGVIPLPILLAHPLALISSNRSSEAEDSPHRSSAKIQPRLAVASCVNYPRTHRLKSFCHRHEGGGGASSEKRCDLQHFSCC